MKILSICGSPRKGNCETILLKMQELLKARGADNEIVLLREKDIGRCRGCVEYCNHTLECRIHDDMQEIMKQMEGADGFIFISPNYFKMPTGLFKDFMDRCSIFYTAGKEEQFSKKKTAVIAIGTDSVENIDVCLTNIAENFARTIGLHVVSMQSFRSHSELKGNYNDIFESGLNPGMEDVLEKMAEGLCG
ncbi:MAG: flavodoxin family protein [Syntrophaceae bacterium]|nr:flavodoxin family protein [Syntrophaceae bacterium]